MRSAWEVPSVSVIVGRDIQEAVERAGGSSVLRPYSHDPERCHVGITFLPDVARFLRSLASLGITATVVYSAGSGWKFDFAPPTEGAAQ